MCIVLGNPGFKIGDIRMLRYLGWKGGHDFWECRCERVRSDGRYCGKIFNAVEYKILLGHQKSCGCHKEDSMGGLT